MAVKRCETKARIVKEIGKDPGDFTEADWDILFAHTENCLVCRPNLMEADKFLAKHLKSAIRDFNRPLAKVLKFKPPKGQKPKRSE